MTMKTSSVFKQMRRCRWSKLPSRPLHADFPPTNMIAIALSIVAICVLVAELWTGFAVCGLSGDDLVIDRRKSPGPYWFMMSLHGVASVAIPLLAAAAT